MTGFPIAENVNGAPVLRIHSNIKDACDSLLRGGESDGARTRDLRRDRPTL